MAVSSATMTTRVDNDIDLGQVGRSLWQKRLWILLPTLIVGALTFFPALSLGPVVEHFMMLRGQVF